ncbi:hypothetical protein QN277_013019 [Acacia crassicarpa]|uniref:Uncharacterized protein n=1 Tax=Acacia crassicarpa TaxID=499986 RepID=A0AAE1TEB7_9FABA|nr:hypothetical protein QN277_013019 [Acacia crassicarpa]
MVCNFPFLQTIQNSRFQSSYLTTGRRRHREESCLCASQQRSADESPVCKRGLGLWPMTSLRRRTLRCRFFHGIPVRVLERKVFLVYSSDLNRAYETFIRHWK